MRVQGLESRVEGGKWRIEGWTADGNNWCGLQMALTWRCLDSAGL
jgi:hypothetical protein